MMYAYSDMECDRHNFLSFYAILTPILTPLKNAKSTWRYYPVTHVYHKSKSYDVWFLRYKMQWTESLIILDHFLPFDPPINPKNHFTLVYHK